MTTPNNAAALERLADRLERVLCAEMQDREERDSIVAELRTLTQPDALTRQPSEVKRWQPSSFMEPGRSHVYARMQESDHGAFVLFDDYQKLLNSQPSGESVAWMVVERENGPPVKLCYDREDASDWIVSASSEYRNQQCPGPSYRTLPLYAHPSSDAQGVAVDEAMVDRAAKAYCKWFVCGSNGVNTLALRAALTAALAPKPEGGHG